jgi:dephospho-CoA kinase
MARQPLWIGLTGGIASGKSAVASEFAKLGVPIIDTDELAREVVQPGEPALQAVVDRFGADVLDTHGALDRQRMRERIFSNTAEKQALEAILHPAIRSEQQTRSTMLGGAYQIHVVPLLAETQGRDLYDRILVVDCDPTTQMNRLLQRDGISRQLAAAMMAAQATRAQRLALADDVLNNDDRIEDLPEKIGILHRRYLQLAGQR